MKPMSKTTLTLSVLLTVFAVGVGIGHDLWKPDTQSPARPLSKGAGNSPSVSAMAGAVGPGLVDINATLDDPGKHTMATGIVLTPSGLVLTNNHVINGATVLRATDVGNGRTYQASVVGYDRNHDIALLKLDGAAGLKNERVWQFIECRRRPGDRRRRQRGRCRRYPQCSRGIGGRA